MVLTVAHCAVKFHQFLSYRTDIKLVQNVLSGGSSQRLPRLRIGQYVHETTIELCYIFFSHQKSVHAIFNEFGDAAVACGDHGHPGRHGFFQGVGNSVCVALAGSRARLYENMGPTDFIECLCVRDPTPQRYMGGDLEALYQVLEFGAVGSLANDRVIQSETTV